MVEFRDELRGKEGEMKYSLLVDIFLSSHLQEITSKFSSLTSRYTSSFLIM